MNKFKKIIGFMLCLLISVGAVAENPTLDFGSGDYALSDMQVTVTVDNEAVNTVREAMFGANSMYRRGGWGILDESSGEFIDEAVVIFEGSGITSLRYPGGTEGDFFHWQETIGALEDRTPQINPWSNPIDSGLNGQPYDVVYGVDEWIEFCKMTGRAITLQINVGTGTAREAADFVRYCLDSGVKIDIICVGNEAHMEEERVPEIRVTRTPEEYIEFYNDVLKELGEETLEELKQRGILFGCIGLPASHALNIYRSWDELVLSGIDMPADIIDLHIGYSPLWINAEKDTDEKVYKCLLASAQWVRRLLDNEIATIEEYSPDTQIAITEYAPHGGSMVYGTAGGMYLASFMQMALNEPRIAAMDYVFSFCPNQEALIYCDLNGTYRTTLLGQVFDLYSAQSGRQVLKVSNEGAKAFMSSAVGSMPRIKNVTEGEAAVYFDPETGEGSLFILNRSYSENTSFDITLPFESYAITAITEMWDSDYGKTNSPSFPDAVALKQLDMTAFECEGDSLEVILKPVSLVKIDFTAKIN